MWPLVDYYQQAGSFKLLSTSDGQVNESFLANLRHEKANIVPLAAAIASALATTTTTATATATTTTTGSTTGRSIGVDANLALQQSLNRFNDHLKQKEQCQSIQNLFGDLYCPNESELELGFDTRLTNFSDVEQLWIRKEWPDVLMRVSLVAPIVLLGIIGNLTIVWSICKFKPFRSKTTNIFILNMAIADLLTALVCPIAALFTYIYQFYVLGSFICRFEGFSKITCLLVSAYSLIVLSSEWLLCVIQPCRDRITIKQSWLMLATIWIISILMASPLFLWRNLHQRQWRDLTEVWCCEMIQYTKYYWIVITFFLIYLPTFCMTVVLIIILAQMEKFETKLKRSNNNSLTINMKYRRRIVKILFTYLLTSIICWTPFQFTIIYRFFRSEAVLPTWYEECIFFSQLFASLTAAMNPIIFGFLSQPFRKIVTRSWMFRFIDKIMINKRNDKNDQQQMEPIPANRNQFQVQYNHHHNVNHQQQQQQHNHIHQLATTSGQSKQQAGSSKQTSNRTESNQQSSRYRNDSNQIKTTETNIGDRYWKSKLKHDNQISKQVSPCDKKPASAANAAGEHHQRRARRKRDRKQKRHQNRGCDNAAYESTIVPDSSKRFDNDNQSRQDFTVGTTSFISNNNNRLVQQHYYSPTSLVSMNSINIEENLGSGIEEDQRQSSD